jgi:hypothetical protein
MPLYKTIVLELIQEQPELYEQLRSTKRLLPAVDAYAIDLRSLHEAWQKAIALTRPALDPGQSAAEALEMAIEDLQERLPSASSKAEMEPTALDAAMAYLRRHTPTA